MEKHITLGRFSSNLEILALGLLPSLSATQSGQLGGSADVSLSLCSQVALQGAPLPWRLG